MIFGLWLEADLPRRDPCSVGAAPVAAGGMVDGRRDPDAAPSACGGPGERPRVSSRLTWPDPAWLALLAGTLPVGRLAAMRLIVTPITTILRWHRDIVRRRWARLSRRGRSGRPPAPGYGHRSRSAARAAPDVPSAGEARSGGENHPPSAPDSPSRVPDTPLFFWTPRRCPAREADPLRRIIGDTRPGSEE